MEPKMVVTNNKVYDPAYKIAAFLFKNILCKKDCDKKSSKTIKVKNIQNACKLKKRIVKRSIFS